MNRNECFQSVCRFHFHFFYSFIVVLHSLVHSIHVVHGKSFACNECIIHYMTRPLTEFEHGHVSACAETALALTSVLQYISTFDS